MVKTLLSKAGGAGVQAQPLVGELRSNMLWGQKIKT